MTDPIDKKIDSDWKRRAQAEKAQLDAQSRGRKGPEPAGQAEDAEDGMAEGGGSLFASFLSSLAAQAAMYLGLEPDPMTGARRANPEQARYLIDVIGMLEEKTRGNLTPEEDRTLKLVLHELRLAFVEVTQGGGRRPPPPR